MKAQKKPGTRQLNCDYPADVVNDFIEIVEPNATVSITGFMKKYVEEKKQFESLTPDQKLEKHTPDSVMIKNILEGENISEEALLKFNTSLKYLQEIVNTKFELLQESKPKEPLTTHVPVKPTAQIAYQEFIKGDRKKHVEDWSRCQNCVWTAKDFGSECIKCGFKINHNGEEIHEHHFHRETGRCTCQIRQIDFEKEIET